MRRLFLFSLFLVVSVGLLAAGCDATGPSLDENGPGTLELHMTGASTTKALTASADSHETVQSNIDSASVTITRAAIIAQEDSGQGDSTGEAGGIKVLTEEDFTVDLMDLQNGLDTLMTEVELDPGTYAQLRLITADQAFMVFEDGTEREVMVASGQQTGFKVNFEPFTIDSGEDHVQLTLNWDVASSLKGNRQGNLVITPAIQATIDTTGGGS